MSIFCKSSEALALSCCGALENIFISSVDFPWKKNWLIILFGLSVLKLFKRFSTDNPNKMISQFFFQGKSTELIKIFSKAPQQDKARASELLQKMDLSNASKYKDELK